MVQGDNPIELGKSIDGGFSVLDSKSDTHLGIGGHTLKNFKGIAKVVRDSETMKLCVESIQFDGEIVDLYDWNYWSGGELLGPFAQTASIVQLGWNSGLNGSNPEKGKLFFTRFIFSKTKDLFEYREDIYGDIHIDYSLCY